MLTVDGCAVVGCQRTRRPISLSASRRLSTDLAMTLGTQYLVVSWTSGAKLRVNLDSVDTPELYVVALVI